MSTILVIGDPHAGQRSANDRFDWLGKFIVDRRPDTIVCMGDFADLESLSSYDKGKKCFEGRRFTLDCEAVRDAQERMFSPLKVLNEARRINKKKQYNPATILLGGNHDEGRIGKVVQTSPELEGVVCLSALGYTSYWTRYIPFRSSVTLHGVTFSHYFTSGVLGRPISGDTIGKSLLQKRHTSSVVGHSHLLSVHRDITASGSPVWGLSAGCYHEDIPEYATDTCALWWRGVVLLHNVKDGDYEPEFITIGTIKARYA